MDQCGLVLEGGGMRGLYTAGVLELFMERELFFPYVIGVSAGACMAASYLSRQKKRNKRVNIDLVADHRFISWRNIFKSREIFGMDFLFDIIPNQIVPYDYDTFFAGEEEFTVVTTDCMTGEAVYHKKKEYNQDMLKVIRASSSLPFIADAVEYQGRFLLDGGLIDPIPLQKAIMDGYQKNVLIMTHEEEYYQKRNRITNLITFLYRSYPAIAKLMRNRVEVYEKSMSYIKEEEQKGNLFIIRPSLRIKVKMMEKNQKRLTQLYELGLEDAKREYDNLIAWLKN